MACSYRFTPKLSSSLETIATAAVDMLYRRNKLKAWEQGTEAPPGGMNGTLPSYRDGSGHQEERAFSINDGISPFLTG